MKIINSFRFFLVLFCACFLLASCSKSDSKLTAEKPKVVNLAIWSNFVTDEMLQRFEAQTGIHVDVSNYSSNEELLAKLQAGASGYDVIVPADYMVFVMKQLNLLESIDKKKIANVQNLDPKFLKMYFDERNKVSLPFDWGTTGIAINRRLYKDKLRGWSDLFESKTLAGKFTMLDDVRETLGAALKRDGYRLNSINDRELKAAKQTLLTAKKNLKGFTSETLTGLVNGEMAVAHAYSSDALQARARLNGDIDYIIPEEGCTIWVDNLAIPKGAAHLEVAHQLVNYLLSSQVQAERASKLFVAPSSLEAMKGLDASLKQNTGLFPSEESLQRCEMIKDIGENLAQWDRIWTEAKASR